MVQLAVISSLFLLFSSVVSILLFSRSTSSVVSMGVRCRAEEGDREPRRDCNAWTILENSWEKRGKETARHLTEKKEEGAFGATGWDVCAASWMHHDLSPLPLSSLLSAQVPCGPVNSALMSLVRGSSTIRSNWSRALLVATKSFYPLAQLEIEQNVIVWSWNRFITEKCSRFRHHDALHDTNWHLADSASSSISWNQNSPNGLKNLSQRFTSPEESEHRPAEPSGRNITSPEVLGDWNSRVEHEQDVRIGFRRAPSRWVWRLSDFENSKILFLELTIRVGENGIALNSTYQ